MPSNPSSPPSQLAKLRIKYEDEELSIRQIAEKERLSASTVQRRLAEAGAKMRPGHGRGGRTGPTRETVAEARRLYESGQSAYEIASLLGSTDTTVRRWLVKDGVTLRSGGESKRGRVAPAPNVLAYVARRSWQGATAPEIAKEVQESERAVNYWLSLVDAVVQELGPDR